MLLLGDRRHAERPETLLNGDKRHAEWSATLLNGYNGASERSEEPMTDDK
jgi:hypothetical protein